ncbi:MAG: methylenetetrahydrofolate--tRNA-(uracil(54)-C(5))-methyltransferase (FADH(2)-oxidizing) TrmFO [Rickettsiales bacterium]|nr:MAG: methylenetetrahydrofolate--tRNA-(uracil(54)-C(5))-methyltransferase (FADH(2)-oxidizing) TrmFO [Rickettsiales bacterium]
MTKLNIIGGGLAGAEAAWQAANRGVEVNLYEMRTASRKTPAHQTDKIAELVCSNSFRNDDPASAIGLLHAEMRLMNSLIMKAADMTKVPAGSALAMDRDLFADTVSKELHDHPKINIIREEVQDISSEGHWIIATGPLTSDALSEQIQKLTGEDQLAFFDAIAPIVYKESIDFDIAWFQSRYDKGDEVEGGGKDYINCPLNKAQYHNFIEALLASETTEFKEWEKDTPYFNGCLPIEVMAERGVETLRFGPMKPVGLTNQHDPQNKPYAVLQLRQDNKLGTLYNMVGFQTKLKYGSQKEIFSCIPGLEKAEFARLGGLHRNTFINSPKLLGSKLELKCLPNVRFAGQITGVEGYVESAAMGLLAGMFASCEINGKSVQIPPADTAIGSLLAHLTNGADSSTFQPMNINFGLVPQLEERIRSKKERYTALSDRALASLQEWRKGG